MSFSYRTMTHDDVISVDEVWRAAIVPLMSDGATPTPRRKERDEWADLTRFHHFITTDPNGVFVATDDSKIVGICQSSRRGTSFLLSRLGVAPDYQDRGIGRELLSMALAYACNTDEQFIFTSRDPRAIHTYVREGFTLHPCIQLVGRARDAQISRSIRLGSSKDIDLMDEIDQTKRGLSRREDLQLWFDLDTKVLIDDEGGYLLFADNRLFTICACSTEIAKRLLSCALSGAFDHPPLEARWIVKEQQWAITAAMQSGASISVNGAVLTRNVEHFVVPYLPNASLG